MNKTRLYFLLLALHVAALAWWMATGYLRSDLTFLVGLALLPAVTLTRGFPLEKSSVDKAAPSPVSTPTPYRFRFALLALLAAGMTLVVPARTFYFLALAFSAQFLLENWRGRLNAAPIFLVLLLTAVVKTMSTIAGFGIRLELSRLAAGALGMMGWEATAEGNIIRFQGQPFSVDPACLGLSMVDVSFLFGLVLLALFERRLQKRLPGWVLALVLLATAALNVAFNFLRILLVVMFSVMPGTIGHDVVGLAGLLLYVFVPLWWGLAWAYRQFGRPVMSRFLWEKTDGEAPVLSEQSPVRQAKGLLRYILPQILLTIVVAALFFTVQINKPEGIAEAKAIVPIGLPPNCPAQTLPGGIVKYATDSLLIYVKPIRGFYDTEHTPLVCWRGSGYAFGKVWEEQHGTAACYAGLLEKSGDTLSTAWWYDNGRERTISQARWRWLDLGGAPGFSLINVTAKDSALLQRQVNRMLTPDEK